MEFENLQIEVPQNDESSPLYGVKVYEKKYRNKKDFVVGFNPNDQEFQDRKNRRAKRFGIRKPESDTGKEQAVISELIESEQKEGSGGESEKKKQPVTSFDASYFKDLDLGKLDWPSVPDSALEEMRLDAIHIYGVEHMSTKDIFEYFSLFGPDTLEWIDDYSCNVVWEDEDSVVRAMDNMSKTYYALKQLKNITEPKFHSRAESPDANSNLSMSQTIKIEDEESAERDGSTPKDAVIVDEDDIDPKDVWRVAYPYKTYQLFLRPATVSDKKMPGAASRSQYYLLYGKKGNSKSENKVPGIVSKSRKRKLEEMKKRANEIFKTKEPDVKIVPLDELKANVTKMEVDEDDEPVVKRMNLNDAGHKNSMSMIADRVEVGQRLGKRYEDHNDGVTVYDRLGKVNDTMDGSGDDENEYNNQSSRRSSNIRDRLGRAGGEKRIQDRLGGRETNVSGDARKDIDRLRKKQSERGDKNVRSGYRDIGYEDEEAGVYHDIYRADDTKESNRKSDKNSRQRGDDNKNSASMTSSSRKRSPNNLKHRLGKSSDVTHDDDDRTSPRDLRDRLKNKGESRTREDKTGKFSRKEVKEEEDNLLNLCIEIKQERDPLEDIDIEMNDVGDEFEF